MLGKFRATPGPDDPAVAERRRAREAMLAERAARAAQREAAKRAHEPNWPGRRSAQQSSPRRLNGTPRKRGHGPKPSARPLSWPNKKLPGTNAMRRERQRRSSGGRGSGDKTDPLPGRVFQFDLGQTHRPKIILSTICVVLIVGSLLRRWHCSCQRQSC